jgi:hypothetical protein
MLFKERFKDVQALEAELSASWGTFTEEVKAKLVHLEVERSLIVKRRRLGIIIVSVAVVPFLILDALHDIETFRLSFKWIPVLVIYFCVVLPAALYAAVKLFRDPNNVVMQYADILQSMVFAKVFTFFGLVGELIEPTPYTPPIGHESLTFWQRLKQRQAKAKYTSPEAQAAIDLLSQSELVTEPHNTDYIGDLMRVSYGVNELFLAELDLKHVTGSGKNRQTKDIFKGYLVAFDLPTRLEAKTFISTDGDTTGFANQTFLRGLVRNDLRVTELEWNAFENLLRVTTTNEVEARYILTTNFMQDLYDWWVGKKQKIRMSFIGSRMYILFPDSNIRVFGTVRSLETAELRAYILSIAEPFMHVLHLVEDVNIRS